MAVTIQPLADTGRLRVSGDVDTFLTIPANPPEWFICDGEDDGELVDTYFIITSDGAMIRASDSARPRFEVIIEGAGHRATAVAK